METAWSTEVEERTARRAQAQARVAAPLVKTEPLALPVGTKHVLEPESSADGAKRAKLEAEVANWTKGPEVDITSVPLQLVIEGMIEGLRGIQAERLREVLTVCRILGCGERLLSPRSRRGQYRMTPLKRYLSWHHILE